MSPTSFKMPGYELDLHPCHDFANLGPDAYFYVELHATRRRRCAMGCRGACTCIAELQDYTLEVTTRDRRVAAIVTILCDQLHEALEFVRGEDGVPVANPHAYPPGIELEDELKTWLTNRLNEVVA